MVDSGRLLEMGADSSTVGIYRGMIDDSQARAPQADITADFTRSGNTVIFTASVTNNSTVTLSTTNNAAVHGIVYEDYHQSKSNFAGRGSARTIISSLAPGETKSYTITVNLSGVVNYDKLNYIVVVDYRITTKLSVDSGVYDQLNAIRIIPPFSVSPGSLELNVKTADTEMPTGTINIIGIPGQTWTASVNQPFLLINPASGTVPGSLSVTVDKTKLTVGTQTAVITVVDGEGLYQFEVLAVVNFTLSDFNTIPSSITFNFDQDEPAPTAGVLPRGDTRQTWTASANKNWVTLSATTGQVGKSFTVSVDKTRLSPGYQEAIITVADGGGYQSTQVKVKVTYNADGALYLNFLPISLNLSSN